MTAQQHHPHLNDVPDSSGTCAAFCAGFFGKKLNQIKHVPDVPDSKPTPFACARTHTRAQTIRLFSSSHGYIPLHIRHIRHIIDFIEKNRKKGGTVSGTSTQNPAHADPLITVTIKTTQDNAKDVQQIVKNDPELLALVQSLQAQGVFPGLRCLSFTITGTPEHCAQGLKAWPAKKD